MEHKKEEVNLRDIYSIMIYEYVGSNNYRIKNFKNRDEGDEFLPAEVYLVRANNENEAIIECLKHHLVFGAHYDDYTDLFSKTLDNLKYSKTKSKMFKQIEDIIMSDDGLLNIGDNIGSYIGLKYYVTDRLSNLKTRKIISLGLRQY